eukprot:6994975-Alexandrium_andersonii.AAC.1
MRVWHLDLRVLASRFCSMGQEQMHARRTLWPSRARAPNSRARRPRPQHAKLAERALLHG